MLRVGRLVIGLITAGGIMHSAGAQSLEDILTAPARELEQELNNIVPNLLNGLSKKGGSSKNDTYETDETIPAGPSVDLIVPRQVEQADMVRADAPKKSVKYAVQIGFIWAYGQGVYPDFEQGLAWYIEAKRRQVRSRDRSMAREIELGISELTMTDVGQLLGRGQRAAVRGESDYARFFFGRAAELGAPQGMAALGYTYGHNYKNARMEIYWCRRAYLGAKQTGQEYDIDAVNYFCAEESFADLMTKKERAANKKSIVRATAKSEKIRRDTEAMAALAWELASSSYGSGGGYDDAAMEDSMRRDRGYSRNEYDSAPTPQTSGLYGNCHGGAAYGC
jgi:TPR repeat protein